MPEYSNIGKRNTRVDAVKKVTGSCQYCDDLQFPGMLYGRVKRSPHPHAKLLKIDTSEAEKIYGVRAIVTVKDVPECRYGYGLKDRYLFARDKVRYVGEPVAAVAADTERIAERAVELIKVSYEELPAIFDVNEAIKTKPSVIIHPELPKYARDIPSAKTDLGPNVSYHAKIRVGDMDKAFAEADLVVEKEYKADLMHPCPIEAHSSIAKMEPDGKITVWSSSQNPNSTRAQVAVAFAIPLAKVRVITPYIGGAFGGKAMVQTEPIAVALAMKTNRPVKVRFTKGEHIGNTYGRASYTARIKDGIKGNTIVARELRLILDHGGYSESGYLVPGNSKFAVVGTYNIPNVKYDAIGVYTNNPLGGAFRGFGTPEVHWAIESQMDVLAEKLGLDPFEFRKKHLLKEGDTNSIGQKIHSIGVEECMDKVVHSLRQGKGKSEKKNLKRGTGFAIYNKYSMAPTASCVVVKICEDGSVQVRTGAPDVGQGSETVFSQIAAEEFKMPIEKIKVFFGDTDFMPFDHGPISSRVTYCTGNAVKLACQDAIGQMLRAAAKLLKTDHKNLDFSNGEIFLKDDTKKSIKIDQLFTSAALAGVFLDEGGELLGKSTFYQRTHGVDLETGKVIFESPICYYNYGAQGFEIELDIETGEIHILKFYSASDVGKAINPSMVEGQLESALSQGVGIALYEKMTHKDGKVLNSDFVDYKITTAVEIPKLADIKLFIVESSLKDGPYGAKGTGEGVLVPTAPALANAIHDAVGIRFTHLPITPEDILRKLKEKII